MCDSSVNPPSKSRVLRINSILEVCHWPKWKYIAPARTISKMVPKQAILGKWAKARLPSYSKEAIYRDPGKVLGVRYWSTRHNLRKKVLSSTYFWYFSLSQIEDSIQYLEGPNGIWKDHDRHIGVRLDPNICLI